MIRSTKGKFDAFGEWKIEVHRLREVKHLLFDKFQGRKNLAIMHGNCHRIFLVLGVGQGLPRQKI